MLASDGTLSGIHLVPALVILCREILVSGLREFLAAADVSLPVTRIAKVKTTVQVAAIAALIASSATERMLPGVTIGALVGMWVAAGLTFYTGYAYLQARALAHPRRPAKAEIGEARRGRRASGAQRTETRVKLLYFASGPAEGRPLRRGPCPPLDVTTVQSLVDFLRGRGAGYAAAFASPSCCAARSTRRMRGSMPASAPTTRCAFFPPVTGG